MTVDPLKPDLPDGTVVPAVEAVDWSRNSDIRPRILDTTNTSWGWNRMISTKLSCFLLTKIKAKIKALLSFVTVLSNTQRILYLEPGTKSELPEAWLKKSSSPRAEINNAAIAFQVACMEKLDKAQKGEKTINQPTSWSSTRLNTLR